MNVPALHSGAVQEFCQLFGHALGQRRHQHALLLFYLLVNLLEQIIDLVAAGPDVNDGVEQPRWADELFDDHAF